METLYKVIWKDGLDRESVADRETEYKNLTEREAKAKAYELNKKGTDLDWYAAVPMGYNLYRPYY